MNLYKVMLVDDEADAREAIAKCVDWNAIGYQVVAEAENGEGDPEVYHQLALNGTGQRGTRERSRKADSAEELYSYGVLNSRFD